MRILFGLATLLSALISIDLYAQSSCTVNLIVDGALISSFTEADCRDALRECSKYKARNYRDMNVQADCLRDNSSNNPDPINEPSTGALVIPDNSLLGHYLSKDTLRTVEIFTDYSGNLIGSYKGQSNGQVYQLGANLKFRSGSNEFTMSPTGSSCYSLSWRNLNNGSIYNNRDVLCKGFEPASYGRVSGTWFSSQTLRSVSFRKTQNDIQASYKGQSFGKVRVLLGDKIVFTSGSNKFFMDVDGQGCASLSWINLNNSNVYRNRDTLCQAREHLSDTQLLRGLWSSFQTGRFVDIIDQQSGMVASYKNQSLGKLFYIRAQRKLIFDSGANRFFIKLDSPNAVCGSLSWINLNNSNLYSNRDRLCHMLDSLPLSFMELSHKYLSASTLREVDIRFINGQYFASYKGQSEGKVSFHPETFEAIFISGANEFKLGMNQNGACSQLSWRNLNNGNVYLNRDTLCGALEMLPHQEVRLRGHWSAQSSGRYVDIRKVPQGLDASYKGQSLGEVFYIPQLDSIFFRSGANRFQMKGVGSQCMSLGWINLNNSNHYPNRDTLCHMQ